MNSNFGHLFSDGTLFAYIQGLNRDVAVEIDAITEAQLLSGNLDECTARLVEKYQIIPITLLMDKIVIDRETARVDVRYDWNRAIRDQSRPHYVEGTCFTFIVPFTGEPAILRFQPATHQTSSPLGEVVGNEMRVKYTAVELDPQRVRADFDQNLDKIKQHLAWGESEIGSFNGSLPSSVKNRFAERREKFLKDGRAAEALGFPLRNRPGAPQFYNVPVQRKKAPVVVASKSGQPVQMDPILDGKAYDSILQTISSMARVMELNPKAFSAMDEESLRFMLLVPLNIHYEGQATGETFNWEGKTDIIIKVGGRNVFVAECKIWKGAEVFSATIDQLLGYTSWRDTKTAIILFNRNKNLSSVLSQIPGLVKLHPNFEREVSSYQNETASRFVLHHRDDKSRELTVTVLVFDVPS